MPPSCSTTLLLLQGILSYSTASISCQPTPKFFTLYRTKFKKNLSKKPIKCNYSLSHITLFLCLDFYLHSRSVKHLGIALTQKNIMQGCPVFCTGGHNHRRITDFHSQCHVISVFSNKMSLFKILKASPFAIVLNKLKSLQIHRLLPFINSKRWTELLSWLWGFSLQMVASGRTHPEHPVAISRNAIDFDGNSTSHQDIGWPCPADILHGITLGKPGATDYNQCFITDSSQ